MAHDTDTIEQEEKHVAEAVETAPADDAAPVEGVEEVAPAKDAAATAVEVPATADAPADDGEDASSEDEADSAEDDEDSEDSLTYSNGVIEKIVAMATRTVPHVLGMKGNLMHFVQEQFGAENLAKGVTVEVTDDNRVLVHISVIIEYGAYAPAIFDDVKAAVTAALEQMTGLEVAGINLRIEDVITREEYEQKRPHHKDEEAE